MSEVVNWYEIRNQQHQPVLVFETINAANDYVTELRETYTDEGFYIVQLGIVASVGMKTGVRR